MGGAGKDRRERAEVRSIVWLHHDVRAALGEARGEKRGFEATEKAVSSDKRSVTGGSRAGETRREFKEGKKQN